MSYDPVPPFRRDFDAARDPYTARNALGITDTGGGGGGAPTNAEYITGSADATLTNERVLTNTATVTWDFSTAGQAKANAAGFGNVSNYGTPAAGEMAQWVSATQIKGVPLGGLPFQASDADLSSIAGYGGTGTWLYRSAADTWSPVTIGGNLTFSGGTLNTAVAPQPLDATLTALAAYNTNGLLTQTAADTFVGRTLTAPAAGITISNPAGIAGNPTFALADDLAALEGLSGTNTIYYRSGASAWSAVTIGSGLTFSAGTLDAPVFTSVAKGEVPSSGGGTANFLRADGTWATPAGGGNVSNTGTPVANQMAVWTAATTIKGDANLTWDGTSLVVNGREAVGHTANLFAHQLEVHGLGAAVESITRWSNDVNAPLFALRKAKSGTIGSNGATGANDVIGDIEFQPGYASGFGNGIRLRAVADDGVFGAALTAGVHLEYWTATSAGQTFSEKIRFYPSGGVDFDRSTPADPGTGAIKGKWKGVTDGSDAPAGYVGEVLTASASGVAISGSVFTAVVSLSLTAGDWDVWGGMVIPASGGATGYINLTLTAGVSDTAPGAQANWVSGSLSDAYVLAPKRRFSAATALTAYLNVRPTGGVTVNASITARRRR